MFTNSENHFSLSTLGLSNFCQVILPLPGIKYFIIRAHILYKLQADIRTCLNMYLLRECLRWK